MSSNTATIDAVPQQYAATLLTRMEQFRQREELFDVILVAGAGESEKRMPAHQLVLSAASDYFANIFRGSVREASVPVVKLPDVSADLMQSLLQYCYSGRIEITTSSAQALLTAASHVQLSGVVAECVEFLCKNLDPENCLDVSQFAEQNRCSDLLTKVRAYIGQNIAKISEDKFLRLDVGSLMNLMTSADLTPSSEESRFNSLMSWIQHDLPNRKKHLPELLDLVDLSSLPPALVQKRMAPISKKFATAASNPIKEISLEQQEQQHDDVLLITQQWSMDEMFIERYCPKQRNPTAWKERLRKQFGCSVAILDDKLLIMGGITDLGYTKECRSIDLRTKELSDMTPMLQPRELFGAAVCDGLLYAVGGVLNNQHLSSVECYSPQTGAWSQVESMSCGRQSLGVAALGGLLYAVGGWNNKTLNSVEAFNPKTNKWTPRAPMNVARDEFGITSANGFLYVLGGYPTKNSFERFDPNLNKWTQLRSVSTDLSYASCAIFGERLLACGLDLMENSVGFLYNFEKDAWTRDNSIQYEKMDRFVTISIPHI